MWLTRMVILLVSFILLDAQSDPGLLAEKNFRIAQLRELLEEQLNFSLPLRPEVLVDEVPGEVFEEYRVLQEAQKAEEANVRPPQSDKAQKVSSFKGFGVEIQSTGKYHQSGGRLLQRQYRLDFEFQVPSNHSISTVQLVLYQLPVLQEHHEWTGILQSVEIAKIMTADSKELKSPIATKMLTFGEEGHKIIDLSSDDLTWIEECILNNKGTISLELTVYFSGYLGGISDSDDGEGDSGDGEVDNAVSDFGSSNEPQVFHIVPPGIGFGLNHSSPQQAPRLVIMSQEIENTPSRSKRYSIHDYNNERFCTDEKRHCCLRNTTIDVHNDLGLTFVIHPRQLTFAYCGGYCPLQYGDVLGTPPVYQSINRKLPHILPCCAPSKVTDLIVVTSLKYTPVLRFYNATVLSCKCF